jgi:membrane-bound metal-dependent hydrolase YbcI (DUF457 family)
MFLGHFALGLALKKLEPRVSLATAFLAGQLADTVWPVLVLAGVEHVAIAPGDTAVTPLRFDSYPWSHSLLTLALFGGLFGAVHFGRKRRGRAAVLLGLLVVSHWVLDFVAHRADLPLTPWSAEKVGLGLWSSVSATLVIEAALLAAGVTLALQATRARDGIGRWGLAGFIALLVIIYAGSLLGPPPPDVQTLGVMSLVLPLVLLPLIAWIDSHREPAAGDAASPSQTRH